MRGCQGLTVEQVARVVPALVGRMALRDRALFVVGVATGLRISELLSLDWGDVLAGSAIREQALVRRAATKGRVAGKVVRVPPVARQALEGWRVQARGWLGAGLDWPVFATAGGRRLGRKWAYEVLRRGFEGAGLGLPVPGTHTMRKTFVRLTFSSLCRRRAAGEPIEPLLALRECTGHARMDSLMAYLESQGLAGAASVDEVAQALEAALYGRR